MKLILDLTVHTQEPPPPDQIGQISGDKQSKVNWLIRRWRHSCLTNQICGGLLRHFSHDGDSFIPVRSKRPLIAMTNGLNLNQIWFKCIDHFVFRFSSLFNGPDLTDLKESKYVFKDRKITFLLIAWIKNSIKIPLSPQPRCNLPLDTKFKMYCFSNLD